MKKTKKQTKQKEPKEKKEYSFDIDFSRDLDSFDKEIKESHKNVD